MCVYIYMCVFVCVCVYALCAFLYLDIRVSRCPCTYTCVFVYLNTYLFVYISTFMYICLYNHTHTRVNARTHTHTHTYIYIYFRMSSSIQTDLFFFLEFICLFDSYIGVCFQLVAFVLEHILHKALLMGYSMRLELTRVCSLNDYRDIGLMSRMFGRMFASGPGDQGTIPDRVI